MHEYSLLSSTVLVNDDVKQSIASKICLVNMLSLKMLHPNRDSLLSFSIKRIAVSFLAIVLSAALFYFGGHNIYIFGLFLFLYVPLLTLIKSSENLVIGAVLASHIYTFESIGLTIILNETALVLIGVSCAMATSVYMLNLRKSIIQKQEETEALLRKFLRNIKKQLIHQCSSEEQSQLLEKLDGCITTGLSASIEDNNNDILKDNSYYIMYFQMRREQYQILLHMNGYLKEISITYEEAHKLFDFTEQLANELEELNPANELIRNAKEVEEYYRMAPLPKSREELQNKFIMLRYFSDIISFIEIKQRFSNLHFT